MQGELKKMRIEAFQQADYSGAPVDAFEAMFNPTSYSQKYEIEYNDRQAAGDSGSPQIFGKIKPRDYTFEFVFDGTGATGGGPIDIQSEKVDRFLEVAGKLDGDIHRPRYLKLSWGTLISKCVLTSAEVTYTLFHADGTPLRAKLKASFAENIDDTLRVAEERKSSPDLTHVHTVMQGEHLSLLAYRYYGDASRYYQVARFNNLTDYRRLEAGQVLVFPPIRDVAMGAAP